MNGFWLLALLGRWSMVTGWIELLTRRPLGTKREFVSVDALGGPYDLKMNDPRSYEMLGRDKDGIITPDTVRDGPVYPPLRSYLAASNDMASPGLDQTPDPADPTDPTTRDATGSPSGRRTPDYFGPAASFGQAARYNPPQRSFSSPRPPTREGLGHHQQASSVSSWGDTRTTSPGQPTVPYSPPTTHYYHQGSPNQEGGVNPLGMNRI